MTNGILTFLLLTAAASAQIFGGSNPYTTLSNIDDLTGTGNPGWNQCILPGCNPGGNGIPTSVTQSFANHTQECDANGSMSVATVAPTSTQGTNELQTYKIGVNDSITHFALDVWFYCDSNCGTYVDQLEFDDALFCTSTACTSFPNTPNGVNYMFGSQFNRQSGVFQIFNQAAGAWINATYSGGNVPGAVTTNTWHHLQENVHLVSGDGTSCTYAATTYPTEYYDSIIIDGTLYKVTNTGMCAGNLNASFAHVYLTQAQMDVGPGGTVSLGPTVYYDLWQLGVY